MKKFSWMKIPRILLCFLGIEMVKVSLYAGDAFLLFLIGAGTIALGVFIPKFIRRRTEM